MNTLMDYSPKSDTPRNRPWTARDARELAFLRMAGWTVPRLMARFGRSEASVECRLRRSCVVADGRSILGMSILAIATQDYWRRGAAALGWPCADTAQQARVLGVLFDLGDWASPKRLRELLGVHAVHPMTFSNRLRVLFRRGLAERRGRGRASEYRLAEHLRRARA